MTKREIIQNLTCQLELMTFNPCDGEDISYEDLDDLNRECYDAMKETIKIFEKDEKKKSAIKMFKELGYEQIRGDGNYIIYSLELQHWAGFKSVLFNLNGKNCYIDGIGYNYNSSINIELLEAINQQVKELGWSEYED